MQFKDFLAEGFSKEYAYRVKVAGDCGAEHMSSLESCLQKYNFVSAAPWIRTPIEENPVDFVRHKGVKVVSEVCSTDIILKYPANERILEVWLAVNMGVHADRVIVKGINEPRRAEADMAEKRVATDKDRYVTEEDAALADAEGQEHKAYTEAVGEFDDLMYGEEYNQKFINELQRIRAEKGADYFRTYPSKDEIMGDNLRPTWDALNNGANMGKSEGDKEADITSQHLGGP